jgi:hypothetical protein
MTLKSLVSSKPNGLLLIACSIALLAAIGDRSDSYYDLLRWGISAVAVYCTVVFYKKGDAKFWAFAILAFLFNPIAPVFLEKEIWKVIDFVAALVFLVPLGDKHSESDYKVKPSRLTATNGLGAYANEMNDIKNEYGKLIENVMQETQTKYPAFVFPISLLPASKADITEALEEMERQAADSKDQEGVNIASSARLYLEQFIADEDAYQKNKDLLDNPEWQKAVKKHNKA